jgi:capsular exopolysaccharide synthesis family protein
MSKFFDDTQKAVQWAPPISEGKNLDVVSVLNAIKQDPAVAEIIESTPEESQELKADTVVTVQTKTLLDDNPMPARAVEAYGSLRTRVMKLQASKSIRSIMLTSSVPAEGKTLTSLNLAFSCSKLHNLRVLLVDGDLRSKGLSRLLRISDKPGLSELLGGIVKAEKTVLPTEHENLAVIGSGLLHGQPTELFARPLWSEFIGWASQNYGIVIVDAPPIHSFSDAELISAGCDGILVVVRALSTPREIAQKCVGRMDKRKLVGIVFNGLPGSQETDYAYYGTSN